MTRYSMEPRTRKYVKGYGFLSFTRNLSDKHGKNYWILLSKQDKMLQKLFLKK